MIGALLGNPNIEWITPFMARCRICGQKGEGQITHALDCPEGKAPCRFCGTPTIRMSTRMCDNCWEVHSRLSRMSDSVILQIVADVKRKKP